MAKSFNLESLKVTDPESRVFEGIASVEMSDNGGDVVTPQQIGRLMDKFMSRGGDLNDMHSNRKVGKVLTWWETEIEVTPEVLERAVQANPQNPAVRHVVSRYVGKTLPAIAVRAQIYKDFPYEDTVWDRIKSGEYRGLSFGGRGVPTSYASEHGGFVQQLTAFWEISIVDAPKVALALLTGVNEIAQSDSERKEARDALQKLDESAVEEMQAAMTASTSGAFNATNDETNGDKPINKECDEEIMAEDNPQASEDRTEAPVAISLEALAAKVAELASQVEALQAKSAAPVEASPDGAVAEEVATGEDAEKDPEASPEEPSSPDSPAEEAPAKEDAPAEEAPAEDAEAPKEEKQSDEEAAPEKEEKPADDEEVAQSDKKRISSDARGTEEIKQAGAPEEPAFNPRAIANGTQRVGWNDLNRLAR